MAKIEKIADDEGSSSGDPLCAYRTAAVYQAVDDADLKMRVARVEARLRAADKNIRKAAARRQLTP